MLLIGATASATSCAISCDFGRFGEHPAVHPANSEDDEGNEDFGYLPPGESARTKPKKLRVRPKSGRSVGG